MRPAMLYRRVEVLEVEDIDGHPTVTTSRVSDLLAGGKTDMQFRYIAYDIGIPAEVFTERSLRNSAARVAEAPGGLGCNVVMRTLFLLLLLPLGAFAQDDLWDDEDWGDEQAGSQLERLSRSRLRYALRRGPADRGPATRSRTCAGASSRSGSPARPRSASRPTPATTASRTTGIGDIRDLTLAFAIGNDADVKHRPPGADLGHRRPRVSERPVSEGFRVVFRRSRR